MTTTHTLFARVTIALATLTACPLARAQSAPEKPSSHFHADAEADPTAYVLDGYSLHVGLGYRHVRVDLGAYAMAIPKLVHGSDDFDVSFHGYGAKLQYFPFDEQSGGFVGVDGGVTRVLLQRNGTDLAALDRRYGVGAHAGWRFDLGAGFYATPWVGVSYSFGTENVTLAGKTFEANPVTVFPAVHFGRTFQ